MGDEVQNEAESGSWIPEVFAAAGVTDDMPVEEILKRTDEVANTMAPNTKRRGTGLVLIEGVAVILPVVWLLRRPLDIPPLLAATAGLLSPALVIAFSWWYRWQGVSRVWARARLVAETCRSFVATKHFDVQPAIRMGRVIPALAPLAERMKAEIGEHTGHPETYIKERIRDQKSHYEKKREQAEESRHQLTRWSARLMDLGVAVGASGFVMALHPDSDDWLNRLGGAWADLLFGIAGLSLPLGLLMLQSLRMIGQSTRRTARYTQQILVLAETDRMLQEIENPEREINEVIRRTEMALLSEVMEWYFQIEASEDLYEIRRTQVSAIKAEPMKALPAGFLGRSLTFVGTYSELLLRLTIRRVIWAVAAVTLTLLYVNSKEPSKPANLSQLREFARLLTPDGETFEGNKIAGAHGTMVIVHGMRDGWVPREGDGRHWTTEIFTEVRERTGVRAPQMIVVDWHELSRPSDALPGTDLFPQFRIIEDVAGIKPQAQEIGGFLGMRLIRLMEEGIIARDKPLHLIGHSAGGFVVARAAIVMDAMKRAPENLHVTILDTPFPGREITHLLPKICQAEFYASSGYVNIEKENVDPKLHFVRLKTPDLPSFNDEHSYAWFWYREHIMKEGFDRSPFAPKQ